MWLESPSSLAIAIAIIAAKRKYGKLEEGLLGCLRIHALTRYDRRLKRDTTDCRLSISDGIDLDSSILALAIHVK